MLNDETDFEGPLSEKEVHLIIIALNKLIGNMPVEEEYVAEALIRKLTHA